MTQRTHGFSLIELLITITIVGILAALGAPSFTSMIESRRLVAATEGVYAHLQFARSEAVKLHTDLNLSVKTGTAWCLGMDYDTVNCNCTSAGACMYGASSATANLERNLLGSDFPNITLTSPNSDINYVVDSTRGTITIGSTTTPGVVGDTIELSSPSGLKTHLIFSRLGRIRICTSSSVGGYPAC